MVGRSFLKEEIFDFTGGQSQAVREMVQELLGQGQVLSFSTFGTSMHPLVKTDAIIQIKGIEENKIRLGDVVLIQGLNAHDSKYVLHRVIRRQWNENGIKLVTKGDSSPTDLVQNYQKVEYLGRLVGIHYLGIDYDLERWFWRPVNIGVALLSSFCVLCRNSFLFSQKERPYSDQKWPQKAATLIIRSLIYPAKWLSIRKPQMVNR
jgi:signal peptidase I